MAVGDLDQELVVVADDPVEAKVDHGADCAPAAQMRATASASAVPRAASNPLKPNLLPTIAVLPVGLPCCGPIIRSRILF